MKKTLLILLQFSISIILCSQDVIVFVQGKIEMNPIELDTILIENLNNGSTANLYDLPNGITNYEINLSQGAQVNSISQLSTYDFKVTSNQIGISSFIISSPTSKIIKFELFDIKGQKLFETSSFIESEFNNFVFNNGFTGMSILKITTGSFVYNLKVIGDINHNTSVINTASQTNTCLYTTKSIKSNFTYSSGDTIKITAKKQDYHSNYIFVTPVNNENYTIYLSQPCLDNYTVSDYDGNIYNTVKIGGQCWLKENLNTAHYSDGTEIPQANIYTDWDWPDVKYYFNCSDNIENSDFSGKLYTSAATLRGIFYLDEDLQPINLQGPCPNGWHVPNNDDWQELVDYTNSALNCDYLKSTYGWYNDRNGLDKFGFTILPSGAAKALSNGTGYYYENCDAVTKFWTSSIEDYAIVYYWSVIYDSNLIEKLMSNTQHGYSIRCIKN